MPKLKTESAEPKTAGDLSQGGNARAQLFSFVERWERLQEEKEGIAGDQKEIMAEAKGLGFDTKIMRVVMRRRNMDAADRQEADALLEVYETAIQEAERKATMDSEAEGGE